MEQSRENDMSPGVAGDVHVNRKPIRIDLGNQVLQAELAQPERTSGWLLVAGAAEQPRTRLAADTLRGLHALGLGTLALELPGSDQARRAGADWMQAATRWLQAQPQARDLPLGYLSVGPATASALIAAAAIPEVAAVLAWNGNPARAWEYLGRVSAPTLLMAGKGSPWGTRWSNRLARRLMHTRSDFMVTPGTEPQLEQIAEWYRRHMLSVRAEGKARAATGTAMTAQRRFATAVFLLALGAPLTLFSSGVSSAAQIDTTGAHRTELAASQPQQAAQASADFTDGLSVPAAVVKGDGVGVAAASGAVKVRPTNHDNQFADSVTVGGGHVRGDGVAAKNGGAGKIRRGPKATGSKQLTDTIGVKYFVNTNITFSTSSSASGAMSEASFQHAAVASTKNGGNVSSTLNDAFDGYNTMCISVNNTIATCQTGNANFVIFNKNGPAVVEGNGRQIDFPIQSTGNLSMTRKVFVPSNDSFARWLNYVTNHGSTPMTVTLMIANNLGSDSNTKIVNTSSGDALATTADYWVNSFQNWSGTTSSDPREAHVLWGPGAAVPLTGVHFVDGDDNPYWGYTFTLQPGKTGIIMNFVTLQAKNPAAQAKAAEIIGVPLPVTAARAPQSTGLSANAVQFMSDAEKSEVLNFNAAPAPTPPAQVPEGDTLVLVGTGLAGLAGYAGLRWRARKAK